MTSPVLFESRPDSLDVVLNRPDEGNLITNEMGGEIARVVRSQPEMPEKPVIAVVADAQRNLLRVPVEIDLAMTEPTPKFEPVSSPV